MAEPSDDAIIDDLLEEALADYEGLVPPDVLETIRTHLADTLAASPAGRSLVRQLKPDPVVDRSADVASPGQAQETAPNKKATGTKGEG